MSDSASQTFRQVIASGQALLLDGALGTELYNRGVFINRCFEDANFSAPQLVTEVHTAYLNGGAQALTTNSWGANYLKLRNHNLHDRVSEINKKAASLARAVSQGKAWILGSIGPLGVRIEPFGPTSFGEARGYFREQAAALMEGGADAIIFETFSDISELQQGILAVRELKADIPIIACVVIKEDGNSPYGTPVEWMMRKLDEWDVDVVGLNCSVGPQPMMSSLEKIRACTRKPLCLRPNAGLPKLVDGRHIYMSTPEYLAQFAQNFGKPGPVCRRLLWNLA